MDFIEKRRQAERQQREQYFATYRTLTRKLAAEKLTAAEEKTLNTAIDALSRTLEVVEADVATLRQAAALEPVAAGREQHVSAIATIEADASDFRQREAKIMGELQAEGATIRQRLTQAQDKLNAADRAREDLAALHQQHHKLFDLPSPEATSHRRHIYQNVFVGDIQGQYHGKPLEEVMQNPKTHADLLTVDRADVVALPGQTDAEIDRLLSTIHELIRAEKPGRYLLSATDEPFVKASAGVVLYVDAGGLYDSNIYNFTTKQFAYTFIPAPGQSQEQLDGLISRFRMRLGKEAARRSENDRAGLHGDRSSTTTIQA